jgi:hypothetical protein
MIQNTAQMRVLVAIEPVDGRKGIDSLARVCQDKLAEDPLSGCVFVFRSRSGTAIRLLSGQRNCHRRFRCVTHCRVTLRGYPQVWRFCWGTVSRTEEDSKSKWQRTFPTNAITCWRCWAKCTATKPTRVSVD